jgi:hypothetical protein
MPKEPGFYFYTGDYLKEPALDICSYEARACWIEMLAKLSESPFRGVFATASGEPWTIDQIAGSIRGDTVTNVKAVEELLRKGVASRNQAGAIYSRRMVRDQQAKEQDAARKRRQRNKPCPVNVTPNVTAVSEREGEREKEVSNNSFFYRPEANPPPNGEQLTMLPFAVKMFTRLGIPGNPLLKQTAAKAIELKLNTVNRIKSDAPDATPPEVAAWMEQRTRDFLRNNAGTKSKSLMTFFSEGLYDDTAVLDGMSLDEIRLRRDAAVGKA